MLTAEPPLDVHVAPSILAADLAALGDAVARCAPPLRPPRRTALASHAPRSVEAHCDWLHLDVFDGVAVPNLTFGAGVVAALRPHSALLFDVHLCVTRATAEQLLAPLLAAGAGQISFHPSALGAPGAATDAAVAALVAAIRAGGARAAGSLAPDEPAEHAAAAVAAGAACVNVLCVTPGFGGQRMQAAALDKVRQLRRTHPRLDICVDGGVTEDTVGDAAAAGANAFVAGTAVFGAADPGAAAARLKRLAEEAQRRTPQT
jgi:ribulose-phosphate 3-epimerase